ALPGKTSALSAVVRKNRSAGVSPASEPRQLLLGQHDLCRLEAGDTFFLTTSVSAVRFGVQALACYGRRAAWRLRSKPGTMSSWALVFWLRLRCFVKLVATVFLFRAPVHR